MTTQKDKFQAYTAALQNEICALRDAIELINSKCFIYSVIHNSDCGFDAAQKELKEAIRHAVNLSRASETNPLRALLKQTK